MKLFMSFCAVGLMAAIVAKPVLAIKEFEEQFKRVYVESNKNEDFKKLVAEAKCNVCHIDMENKKKHNPYGLALKEAGLLKKDYQAMIKNDPEKAKKEITALMKKVEEKKDANGKAFGVKIKDGVLPGGDTKGK